MRGYGVALRFYYEEAWFVASPGPWRPYVGRNIRRDTRETRLGLEDFQSERHLGLKMSSKHRFAIALLS